MSRRADGPGPGPSTGQPVAREQAAEWLYNELATGLEPDQRLLPWNRLPGGEKDYYRKKANELLHLLLPVPVPERGPLGGDDGD